MTTEEVIKEIKQQAKELEVLARRSLPKKVGSCAMRHFHDNFRQGGFVNNGLQPWQRSKRQSGKGTDAARTPLMSSHKHLFKSVRYTPSDNRVKIHSNLIYAPIHNWGGNIPITPKMRAYAWYRFFKATGAPPKGVSRKVAAPVPYKGRLKKLSSIYKPSNLSLNQEAVKWKGLALTKKQSIQMPQRQFLGNSKELDEKVSQLIKTEVSKIMNK